MPPEVFDGMMEGHLSGSLGERLENARRIRFATVTSGFDVMSQVWSHEHHVWSSVPDKGCQAGTFDQSETISVGPFARVKQSVLEAFPVDVLCVDVEVPLSVWKKWLLAVSKEFLPCVVVALFPGSSVLCEEHGQVMKAELADLKALGFVCQMFSMFALDFGSSVAQERLVYVLSRVGQCDSPQQHQMPVRSMKNLLRDHLVPRRAWAPLKSIKLQQEQIGPFKICARVRQEPVFDPDGPMPDQDAWVQDSKRIRRLMPEERTKALGWESFSDQVPRVGFKLQRTTGIHLWSSLVWSLWLYI